MAERVRRAGRGRDTMLAHITPQEAELLRARGGSGTINPATGLPEFLDYPYPPESYDYAYDVRESYPAVENLPIVTQSRDLERSPTIYPVTANTRASRVGETPDALSAGNLYGDTGRSFRGAVPSAAPQENSVSPAAGQALPNIGLTSDLGEFNAYSALPDIAMTAAGAGLGGGVLYEGMPIDLGASGFPLGESIKQQPGFDVYRDQALLNLAARPARGGIEDALRGAARQAGEFVKTPLGYGAIGGIPALLQARRASQQARGMREELGRLGQEARTQGQQLVAQARGGQVTAAQQQALNAQRAAAMQNLSRRGITGGTAAQQVERSLQEQKGRFLEDTLNQGMRLLQVADQYTERAIRAQYAADAQAQQLLGNFFQNYMRVLAGQPGTTTTAPTSTQPTPSGR